MTTYVGRERLKGACVANEWRVLCISECAGAFVCNASANWIVIPYEYGSTYFRLIHNSKLHGNLKLWKRREKCENGSK